MDMSGAALLIAQAALVALTPFPDADLTPEQRVAPGTSRVLNVRAADGDALPWTVRVSRSVAGLDCSTVGQMRGADFGLVGLDGVFRTVPEANADACGDPDRLLGERVFAARDARNVRTVVYGVAGAGLERVTLTPAGGREQVVPHSPEGGFAVALRGYPEDVAATVTLRLAGGVTRTQRFPAADGTTVPDPDGGRAWRLQAFGFGVPRGTKAPRVQTGCVLFATARAVPGERNVSSTPVCGHEPARRGVKLKPLYFDTRRLSGDAADGGFMAGDWNHHPARVAVYGSARSHKRIVVRSGRFSATVAPKLNGTFLVFLPRATNVAKVRVTVDGTRYGRRHGLVALPRQFARSSTAGAAQADAEPRRGRLPDGRFSPGYVHYKVSHARIPIRLEDPAGGLPWVLRVFDADRITLQTPARTLAGGRVVGRKRCVQVGRLQDGRFGWVFGDGRFRTTPDVVDRLLQCTSRKAPRAVAGYLTTLTPGLIPNGSIVWGQLPDADAVTVAGTGAADGAAVVADGAFLRVAGPDAHPGAAARVTGGGRSLSIGPRKPPTSPFYRNARFPDLVGPQRLEAPTPDPAGGPPWGVPVAEASEGPPCAGSQTRQVAGRAGSPNPHLGLFDEAVLTNAACRPIGAAGNPRFPCLLSWGGGNAEELEGGEDVWLERGRIERRLLAGRSSVQGQCDANVERLTLETPRDRRVLVPSPVGHVVLAIYDGLFVDAELVLTARLRGGKTVTDTVPIGLF